MNMLLHLHYYYYYYIKIQMHNLAIKIVYFTHVYMYGTNSSVKK